jgi:uncharacterized protein YndB with AHSA1/START domain
MTDHTYVYVLHIATTPEKLWEALTSNEFWQKYWGGEWRIESDWRKGSSLVFYTGDGAFYSKGEVLESDPPRKLTYTWPPSVEEQGSVPPERLTWEIVTSGPATMKLTLTHENLSEKYYKGVSQGWPAVLSSLKTLLETGSPLAIDP